MGRWEWKRSKWFRCVEWGRTVDVMTVVWNKLILVANTATCAQAISRPMLSWRAMSETMALPQLGSVVISTAHYQQRASSCLWSLPPPGTMLISEAILPLGTYLLSGLCYHLRLWGFVLICMTHVTSKVYVDAHGQGHVYVWGLWWTGPIPHCPWES